MSEEGRPELDMKVRDWLINFENRVEKDKSLKKIWEMRVHENAPDEDAYRMLADIRRRLGFEQDSVSVKTTRSLRMQVWTRIAALFVIGLFASGIWFFALRDGVEENTQAILAHSLENATTVSAGEKRVMEVVLPDGSKVWLHRGSTITYPNDFEADRTLHLEGEAYFSVTKQDSEPFSVESKNISVRVLGTEFLVQTGDDAARSIVEVADGTVQATVRNTPYILEAHDRLFYDRETEELILSEIASEEVIARWKDVNLVFDNCSLDAVFERVEEYYDIDIEVEGRLPENERITVSFAEDEPLEEVMYVIEKTSRSFEFEINNDNVKIVKR
jgi:ferric-dicitrate binding protein FerR (iron transport regulator)